MFLHYARFARVTSRHVTLRISGVSVASSDDSGAGRECRRLAEPLGARATADHNPLTPGDIAYNVRALMHREQAVPIPEKETSCRSAP